jgi:hypothetical protein
MLASPGNGTAGRIRMEWWRERISADATRRSDCGAGGQKNVIVAGGGVAAAGMRSASYLIAMVRDLAFLAVVGVGLAGFDRAFAQATDGAACVRNDDCSSGICNAATGLCSRRTTAGAPDGAACARNSECHSGVCDALTRRCGTRDPPGSRPSGGEAACAGDADCISGACDIGSRTCRSKATVGPDGTACATNADCLSGRCNLATGLCTRK